MDLNHILYLVFAVLLIFCGRELFFITVGIIGFLAGMQLAPQYFPQVGNWLILVAIACGVLGALLAVAFQWLAVLILGGMFGGGYLAMKAAAWLPSSGYAQWFFFVIGAVIGIAIVLIAFDGALILISSLLGASLLIDFFNITDQPLRYGVLIVCVLVGALVQSTMLQRSQNKLA